MFLEVPRNDPGRRRIGGALVALQAATGDDEGSAARVREPLQEP